MGNILLNYASTDKLAVLAQLATGFSITFGFPLVFCGCREGIKNVASAVPKLAKVANLVCNDRNHAGLVVSILVVTTLLSVVADDVGLVAGLTGALMGSCLVYVCPALLYSKIVMRKYGSDGPEYEAARRNLIWIPFGIFTALMGVVMTIKNSM